MWYIYVCVAMVLSACVHVQGDSVCVVTPVGTVLGNSSSVYGDFRQFLGIPYGLVDESNPFGPASSYPCFDTPFEAYTSPPVCPQIPESITHDPNPRGDIQCLHLNIYTPQNATAKSTLPVMVYIHGGSYANGDGNVDTFPPSFFMKHDIILVTVNYRLGPYGFLCLPDLDYSNQGIKDIILALKWIKDNISSFGGDEENVLLFGHSSGSHAIDLLLLFCNDNLFNKAIMQSGHIVSPIGYRTPANETYVANLAEKLGIDTEELTTEEIMTQLSNVTTDVLMNVTRSDFYSPCIDNILITKTPENINLTNMIIMTGTNDKEMLGFYQGQLTSYIDTLASDLTQGFNDLIEEGIETVENFYLTEDTKDNAVKFGTDFEFVYPTERTIRYYLNNSAVVYRYVFSYDGGRNYLKVKYNITEAGAAHVDDLGYMFNMSMFGDEISEADNYVINAITTMWTNFAKYGNPTPELTDVITTLWSEMTEDSKSYLNINSTLSLQENLLPERVAFWDSFYNEYGNYSAGYDLGEEYMQDATSCD